MKPHLLAIVLLAATGAGVRAAEPSPTEALPIPATFAPARGGATRSVGDRWFAGGGIGISFGTVDFVEIVPVIGYRFTPRFHAGLQFLYRYRNDSRYGEHISTTDYGATLFARYFVGGGVFVEADYEYLSFEYILYDLSTQRQDERNVLGGVGFSQPMGRHAAFFVVALYNFTTNNDIVGYEEDPWVIRAGVLVGF